MNTIGQWMSFFFFLFFIAFLWFTHGKKYDE